MRPLATLLFSAQSSVSSATSSAVDIRQTVCFSLQVSGGAGNLAGTFQVQVSNTPCLGPFKDYSLQNPVWSNLGTALTFAQVTSATSQIIAKTDVSHVALRVVFTETSTNTALMTVALSTLGL